MQQNTIVTLILVGIPVVALIVFFIWKNKKDQKTLNPDAPDVVEELHIDQQRNSDRS